MLKRVDLFEIGKGCNAEFKSNTKPSNKESCLVGVGYPPRGSYIYTSPLTNL